MTHPLVSVLVPVYNGERFLDEALDSAFAQDYEPFEVVVLDDGSTDSSPEIARRRPVRYLRREHEGIPATRNAAVEAARGELVAFLDADDVWPAGKLSRQVARLTADPALDFVLGRMVVFAEHGVDLPEWFPRAWLEEPQNGLLQTLVARKTVFDEVGLFDLEYDIGEDAEWLARAKDAGARFELLEDVCCRYRIHGANTTHRLREQMPETLLRAMRASVRRQRA
jgi:glycosyltransferase involved in cell wall biosynthesis